MSTSELNAELHRRSSELSAQLRSAADVLASDGTPPPTELAAELSGFIELHDGYLREVAFEEEALRQAELARLAEEARQRELALAQEAARRETEANKQQILTHIQDFQRLTTREPFTALTGQQAAAAAIANRIQDADQLPDDITELPALICGEHPWCGLTRLIAERDQLTDMEWVQITTDIKGQLPDELVSAALRGRLLLDEPERAVEAAPVRVVTPVADLLPAQTVVVEPAASEPVAVESLPVTEDYNSIFDDEVAPPAQEVPESVTIESEQTQRSETLVNALFELAEESDADSSILKQQPSYQDPRGDSAALASEIRRADAFTRGNLYPELIQALIFEGRSGLAFHLARCLEELRQTARPFLPSWMIRAWTLGNAILFPQGQLVGRLQEDFAQYDPVAAEELPAEHRIARELFLRATALRPAIVAPASKAAAIVRSFPMSPEQPQLYNYCARIGSYGERMHGISPTSFKASLAEDLEANRAELRQDVKLWMHEAEAFSVRYAPTNPLFTRAHWSLRAASARRYPNETQVWQQWQETFQTAHRILRNVLADKRTAAAETRAEMERVAALVFESRRAANITLNQEMRNYLLQAVSFGQHWLSLLGRPTDSFVPQDLAELRAEIEARHDGVQAELAEFSQRHSAEPVRMAIGCLMLALDQVRDLVDPDIPTETLEPDHRHLLNAELLKIPGLQLAPNWRPLAEPEDLIEHILKFLISPQPNWLTTIQLQLAADNLDAAEKISLLPVFNREEGRQLQLVLSKYRKQQQEEVWKDLRETELMIEEASRLQILSDQDRAGFAARLERLRRGLTLSHDHRDEIEELHKLRAVIDRRRAREAELAQDRLKQLQGQTPPPPPEPAKPNMSWKMDFFSE